MQQYLNIVVRDQNAINSLKPTSSSAFNFAKLKEMESTSKNHSHRLRPIDSKISVDTSEVLALHIRIFKSVGLWPPDKRNCLNSLHMFLAFGVGAFGFSAILLGTIPYVNSIKQVVDNLMISSSVVLAAIKGIIVYYNKPKLLQLIGMLKDLDTFITKNEEKSIITVILRDCKSIANMFLAVYISAWIVLAAHSVFAVDDRTKIWSSTTLYPFEFAQLRSVYWIVLIFEALANLLLCITDGMTDTYGAILSNILGAHIDVLGQKLNSLGGKENTLNRINAELTEAEIESELKTCVNIYVQCKR